MTPQMRMALSELAFAYAEVQSAAANYEQQRTPVLADQLRRRIKQCERQLGMVASAVVADVRVNVLPVDLREAEPRPAA